MSARTTSNLTGNNLHIIDYYVKFKGFEAFTEEHYRKYMIPATDWFPTNANEALDNDKDGVGDNTDTDDDNDGLTDVFELINKRPSKLGIMMVMEHRVSHQMQMENMNIGLNQVRF